MTDLSNDPRLGTLAAGKYRVIRMLGRGGMSTVYEAENVAIGKRVALKFMAIDLSGDTAMRARFHREARAATAVDSAHIVVVFDTGETERGEPFIVMEMLRGEDLATRIKRSGKLDASEAAGIAAQSLRGLVRAHAAGIVHRDLKPGNLFLTSLDDGTTQVKIVDFGVSKFRDGKGRAPDDVMTSLTQAGSLLGTPLYMSPEQIGAPDLVDHRSDLWSMGAILFEAIAGKPPFSEVSFPALMMAICHRDPPALEGVPPLLASAVRRALSRDLAARFQTADEMLSAILSAMPDVTGTTARGPRPSNPDSGEPRADSGAARAVPGAELKTYTAGSATLWLSQPTTLSIWRGEVAAPDRLRVEGRDGTLHELRLEPVDPDRPLRLGRTEKVGDERNDLVYPDVASRLAATLRHDGVRWWLKRRDECSVPVQVGARALSRGEEAPLVHGTFVSVGGMRATMVDRRFVTPAVPAGTVDTATGLLGRTGIEQEIAAFLQRQRTGGLVVVRGRADLASTQGTPARLHARTPAAVVAIHRAWPSWVTGHVDGTAVLLVPGEASDVSAAAARAADVACSAGLSDLACGYWPLAGEGLDAGREIELALHAVEKLAESPGPSAGAIALRDVAQRARFATSAELLTATTDGRRATLMFAIEEQNALAGVGPFVVGALEQELAAVVASHAGPSALIAPMAPGVVVACVSRKQDFSAIGSRVQCDWHARPPIMDGKAELPRTLSWEILHGDGAEARAAELSRECRDAHGVLSALSGGLPYPIAGRVHAAIAASSAIERVKMLFDVLEGTWRFIATVVLSAFFAKRSGGEGTPSGIQPMLELHSRLGSRDGYALGTWRELARTAARAFDEKSDPIAVMAREVLDVRLAHNQTFETLSNLLQAERNGFAHGHYNEARAAADLAEFEGMTRTLLRALRPLCAWTLVTVEKTEPDLYGELQMVEFIDHTGPFHVGTRRRIGLNSPLRLANVVYLARWREGLVLPLEPMLKRLVVADRSDLYWMDHVPRAGLCSMSSVVESASTKITCDPKRLPPLMRTMLEKGQP